MSGRNAAALCSWPSRLDGVGAIGAPQRAGGEIHVAVVHRVGDGIDADLARGECLRIELDAHGVLL